MQKIRIENNGPIKEFEMVVNKFNLLIGEQATGKSTIAKSIYFFRIIKTSIIDYLTQICNMNTYKDKEQNGKKFYKEIKGGLKDIFVKLFGHSWELNPELKMHYEYAEDIWIRVALFDGNRKGKMLIDVEYSPQIIQKIGALQKEVREMYQTGREVPLSLALANEERKRNHEIIINRVNEIFCDDQETYYIPAGRSLLTVMSSNRAMMNSATNLDLITEKFMMLIDNIRPDFKQGVSKAYKYHPVAERKYDVRTIADTIVNIQKGEYYFSEGREYLKIQEDEEHPIAINFASSGQQEVLWMLNFIYVLLLRQENAFVIIEEPEAHIYPTLQKKIMEFISLFTNVGNNSVFITTHSPYMLTVTNNLYYAGVLAHEGQGKKVAKVLDENYAIRYGDLAAYKLLKQNELYLGRHFQKLFEDDNREIKTGLIDEVSAEINQLYTALYDIELDEE